MGKKIWILNHYAISPDMGGSTRHYDFAEELVKRGHHVTIFASSFDHRLRKETLKKGEKYRKEVINGVVFVWLKTFPYKKNNFRRVLNMFSFALNLYMHGSMEEKPDIILVSSFHPLTCISGYFLARKKGARYLAEIRDLWPQTAIDMGVINENSVVAKVLKFIERYIYLRAEKIIVLLPGAVDYIKSIGINEDKVVYIPNGVTVKRYDDILSNKKKSSDVENILASHKNKFNAIYLGALGQANALDVIIDAAKIIQEKKYNNIDILMVGDGPEKEHLMQKTKEYNLKNVFFYEPVKKYEVPLLLDKIDLQLISMKDIPLYKYGISLNKLFDYLCSKKPIVFSGKVLNDIVAESNSGLSIPPENPEAFAEAIIHMYKMPKDQREKLGENGRRYVEKYHDIPKLVDKLEEILECF